MWSPCPWVTRSTSHSLRWRPALRGLFGLLSHGSNRITLPPGVRTSTAACPSQVNEVSRPIAIRASCLAGVRRQYARASGGPRVERAATLGPWPPSRSRRHLSLINWTVLVAPRDRLVRGGRVRAGFGHPATKGFLAFTAACAVGWGLLAYLSDTRWRCRPGAVSDGLAGRHRPGVRRAATRRAGRVPRVLAWSTTIVLVARRTRTDPGIAGVVAGLSVLAARRAHLGRRPRRARAALALQLVVLTLATGRRVRGDDPRPLVPRHAEAARGARSCSVVAPAVLGRGAPGRAVRDVGRARDRARGRRAGRSRRCSGRGRCSCGCG